MIAESTAVFLPTKISSDDDSGLSYYFQTKTPLPLIQSALEVPLVTDKLCWLVLTLWECHIYNDTEMTLIWIFFSFSSIYIFSYLIVKDQD